MLDEKRALLAASFADNVIGLAGNGDFLHRAATFERHAEVAEHEEDGANGDGFTRTEETVSQNAADHGDQIDERGVRAVEALRLVVRKQEVLGEINYQQRAHPVEREALPHLGEEQRHESTGVSHERLFGGPARGRVSHI